MDRLTVAEYNLLMKAQRLKQVYQEYLIHQQAFQNYRVKATRGKKGTPVYRNFKKFYDYESRLNEVLEPKNTNQENNRLVEAGRMLIDTEKGG